VWLKRFRNRPGLENIKIFGKITSVNEEADAIFLAELEKMIKKEGYHPMHVFNCSEFELC
jgi:hypothetical protein